MSAHALEFGRGEELTVGGLLERLAPWLPACDGVTISGGEPFDQPEGLPALLEGLKSRGVRDILAYTGYAHESLRVRAPRALAVLDALVDGTFNPGEETDAHWKGSENQRLIILSRDPALKERYEQYAVGMQARLQVVKHRGGIFVLGIPRQGDAEVIVNGAN
jgi:anaerobic ribonucleoside-triphosphate reductase activating protein